MKLKSVKLYRPIMVNGTNRESLSGKDITISYNQDLNMIVFIDRKNIEILIPMTNVEHLIPEEPLSTPKVKAKKLESL